MSLAADHDPDGLARHSRSMWGLAALLAVALHLGLAAALLHRSAPLIASEDPGAQGLEIGLELAAPEEAPTDLPVGPPSVAQAASAAAVERPAEPPPDEVKPLPTDSPDPDRVVVPETPRVEQTPAQATAPATAMAPPSNAVARPSERSVTTTQGLGEARERARVKWRGELAAHLDRHKRFPATHNLPSAEVTVGFTLDRAGHFVAIAVVQSSGDPAYDAAALEMLKRSDPVPRPPPDVPDQGLHFTVPVAFRLHGR
jgi:periplasmic protein TonB